MERKRLIALVIIAIIIVGVLGWYFLSTRPEETKPLQVFIDANHYTTPLTLNATAVNGTMIESPSHDLINQEINPMRAQFTFNVWHYNTSTNQWTMEFNGTHWLVNQNVATILVSMGNQTKVSRFSYASLKKIDPSFYYVSLTHTDRMIYVNFVFTGRNATVDGETVFAYLAFDGNGNNTLDAQDKAFNFTNNPKRSSINQLKIYTPKNATAWNTTATEYSWNENVSPSTMPVAVVISNDRKNITWAIPFSYIGAQRDKNIGFFFQAFGYDWGVEGATPTTPAKYEKVSLALAEVLSFNLEPLQTIRFFVRVWFGARASGDYSFVYTATVRQSS